jgi:hypothetical protein
MSHNESLPVRVAALHRPLVVVAAVMAALSVLALGGLIFDDRTLVNAPLWLKPFKFTVSIMLYTVTLAWMLSLLPRAKRWGWWLGTIVAAMLGFEMVLLGWQIVFRGRQLHFNHAGQTDTFIGNLLAGGAYLVWLATLAVALLLLFQRLPDKAQGAAVRTGLTVALIGLALGMLMFYPTPGQMAAITGGHKPSIVGAHSVGVPDGGPGLPILGWSTVGGDLRIPHFVGMHALQLFPLFAMLLSALRRRFPALTDVLVRRRLIRVAGLGYLGLIAILTWQALRGQSIVHPDGWTLLAVAADAALVGLGARVVAAPVGPARKAGQPQQ